MVLDYVAGGEMFSYLRNVGEFRQEPPTIIIIIIIIRRHSRTSKPRHIAVVSQMCINTGVIVISVKMPLLTCDLDL